MKTNWKNHFHLYLGSYLGHLMMVLGLGLVLLTPLGFLLGLVSSFGYMPLGFAFGLLPMGFGGMLCYAGTVFVRISESKREIAREEIQANIGTGEYIKNRAAQKKAVTVYIAYATATVCALVGGSLWGLHVASIRWSKLVFSWPMWGLIITCLMNVDFARKLSSEYASGAPIRWSAYIILGFFNAVVLGFLYFLLTLHLMY